MLFLLAALATTSSAVGSSGQEGCSAWQGKRGYVRCSADIRTAGSSQILWQTWHLRWRTSSGFQVGGPAKPQWGGSISGWMKAFLQLYPGKLQWCPSILSHLL